MWNTGTLDQWRLVLCAASPALLLAPTAAAGQAGPEVIVVTAPGGALDSDDAIGVGHDGLNRGGVPGLLGAMARDVPGLALSDAQGNPWQPNIAYRGYSASPLQGNAQGLAVYVDGARFNHPFGDTVNLDLLPDAAIERVTVKDVSPVYGLNAQGGVIVVATRTGRTAPGLTLYGAGGSDGHGEGGAEAGWSAGGFSAYAALQERHDGGWRRHSPSTLYNGYADLGWDGADGGVHVKAIGADTDLTGNGTAPAELLAADYRAVLTYPDNTRNAYARLSFHPWWRISAATRIEASLAVQRFRQRTLSGDAADIAACDDDPGRLCLGDRGELLRDLSGNPVAGFAGQPTYALLNRSRTRSVSTNLLVQVDDRRALAGGENELVVGFSQDSGRTWFSSASELGALTPARAVAGLGPVIAQPDGAIAPVGLRAWTRYTGLFLSDRLPITARLSAEIGLRWNDAHIRLADQLGTALNGDHRFRRTNPGIEFDYAVSKALSLRAGYSEANRAPTPAELGCADEAAPCSLTNFFVADPPLRQVVSRSWEAGASGQIAGPWKLQWQVSAYRSDSRDDIQFTASAIRGRAYFRNIGGTRRQGVELSASAGRGGWSVRANYAFTDATFRAPLVLNSPDNPFADANGQIAVMPGNRLPGIARHRAVLAVDHDGRRFSVGGDVQVQSGQYLFGDEANRLAPTKGFAVINLRAGARLAGGVSLFAQVNNLFDTHYATFATLGATSAIALAEAPGASDPRSLGPGAPRRWLAGIRAQFR